MRAGYIATACVALLAALSASAAHAATVQIRMEKLGFVPPQASAHVGDTVEWVNNDFVAHTAAARNGAWDVTIPAKATVRVVVKVDGAVDYYCRFHPNMTGRIDVAK